MVLGASVAAAELPFTPHTVSRQAAFTFAAGRQVYELVAPDGTVWVMQTYSQSKDPTLSMADLPGLASRADAAGRLDLPGADPDPAARGGDGHEGRARTPGQSPEQLFGGDAGVTATAVPQGAAPPVTLFGHWICPYSVRVSFALAERASPTTWWTSRRPPSGHRGSSSRPSSSRTRPAGRSRWCAWAAPTGPTRCRSSNGWRTRVPGPPAPAGRSGGAGTGSATPHGLDRPRGSSRPMIGVYYGTDPDSIAARRHVLWPRPWPGWGSGCGDGRGWPATDRHWPRRRWSRSTCASPASCASASTDRRPPGWLATSRAGART